MVWIIYNFYSHISNRLKYVPSVFDVGVVVAGSRLSAVHHNTNEFVELLLHIGGARTPATKTAII